MAVEAERVARSVALEQAYVHDVYEQFSDGPRGKPWQRVQQFLSDLEPGSLVCDVDVVKKYLCALQEENISSQSACLSPSLAQVTILYTDWNETLFSLGCGNGKYLNTNHSVFHVGGDKCGKLVETARDKDSEVMILDNLSLPFRDESFDAVLSIAVVHHFATTERRVCALRELARVLRIGGRLIISVWAMEQQHRKFESQDVLVPWHRPQHLSTPSLELTSTTSASEEDFQPAYHAYTQSDSDSNKSIKQKGGVRKRGRNRHKGRSIDPGRNSSPSSSSLSSPNETCYSFVRRAIQKLAGGRRGRVNRPWFLDSWSYCSKEPPPRRYDPEGCECCECEDVQNLPIELRRVDDDEMPQRRQTFPSSQLTNDLYSSVKSRSLTDMKTVDSQEMVRSQSGIEILQEIPPAEENDNKPTPERTGSLKKPRLVKQKQSICDEDAEEALDKPTDMKTLISPNPDVRFVYGSRSRGVLKQRSLNEELMSTDRIKENERVKRNIQKQASLNDDFLYRRQHALDSIKDSLFSVSTSKRFQLIKTGFTNKIKNSTTNIEKVTGSTIKNGFVRMFQGWKSNDLVSPTKTEQSVDEEAKLVPSVVADKTEGRKEGERRHSKEEGSDSSKDSSLQSDTSVDSEDSFASVIFIPKADPTSPTSTLSPGPTSPRLKQQSVPNSPRIKQSSCPTSPRIKQMPLRDPLTKQLSSPKPSTNFSISPSEEKQPERGDQTKTLLTLAQKYSVPKIPKFRKSETTVEKTDSESKRNDRLKQIRELLNQRPGFGVRTPRSSFPIVRHSSASDEDKLKRVVKPMPKLLSLELFNPETDDKDSDSSGVSSPDSVDSVISVQENGNSDIKVIKEENCTFSFPPVNTTENNNENKKTNSTTTSTNTTTNAARSTTVTSTSSASSTSLKTTATTNTTKNSSSMSLLEAAANVANSLDDAVDRVIRSSPRAKRNQLQFKDVMSVMERYYDTESTPLLAPRKPSWDEECHKHLSDFADKLSEKLLAEIDSYNEKIKQKELAFGSSSTIEHIDDPYIHRLSEELQDLSKLSAEIQKQNEYLHKLTNLDRASEQKLRAINENNKCVNCKLKCCKCSSGEQQSKVPSTTTTSTTTTATTTTTTAATETQTNKNLNKSFSESKSVAGSECRLSVSKTGSSIESCDSEKGTSSTNSISCSIATSLHLENSNSDKDTCSRYSDGGSTASLGSCPEWTSTVKNNNNNHPSSNSKPQDSIKLNKDKATLLSDTSQESLPSDNIGGSITYHRYYHVFREGELDQLIERYVENLHIISSYYDHASWCVVAEKVQVWTI